MGFCLTPNKMKTSIIYKNIYKVKQIINKAEFKLYMVGIIDIHIHKILLLN